MDIEVRSMQPMRTIYAERKGYKNHNFSDAATQAFDALMAYLTKHNLWNRVGSPIGYMPDDMMSGSPDEWRYQVHYVVNDDAPIPADADVKEARLEPGKVAVFAHYGPYAELSASWQKVMGDLLPASGLIMRHEPPFEIYVGDPDTTPPAELLTEICIPVE